MLCLLLAALPGCEERPEFEGTGGVLDNPLGIAVLWPYAYVTNANFDLSNDKKGWLTVVDLRTALVRRDKALVHREETKPFLGKIIINSEGTLAYVADRRSNEVRIFSLENPAQPRQIDLDPENEGVQGIAVARQPYGMVISPDGAKMFVTCIGSGAVSIIDLESRKLAKNIPLSNGVTEIALDPAGQYVYVTNQDVNAITLLDANSGNFVTAFSAGGGRNLFGFDFRGLAFTPDGKYLYVAQRIPSGLLMVDTSRLPLYPDRAILRVLPTDISPMNVAVTPDGAEVWVTNYDSYTVQAFDATTGNMVASLETGQGPVDIQFFSRPENPDVYYGLVANFNSHNLTLFNATTKEVIWAIP